MATADTTLSRPGDRRPAARPGLLDRIATTAYGTRQTAVVRIALSLIWIALLLRELPNRHLIWGPDGPWGFDQASRAMDNTGGFSFFGWHDGTLWFELCYAASFVVACCMLVGWRTRTAAVLFALFMMSFQHRNEYVLNAGENILRITAIYLVFTRCAEVWSVDARNRRRRAGGADHTGTALWAVIGLGLGYATYLGHPSATWAVLLWTAWLLYGGLWQLRRGGDPQLRTLHELLSNLVHNAAVVLIAVQICLLYAAAGWYKVQGELWQDGTAVHWSMNIGFLNSWPQLTDLLTGHSWIVLLLTYATVMVQVAFPFSLLNRRAKNVLLAVLIVEHLGIALLMGLVFFSLAMIAVDLIFLPTTLLLRVERYAASLWARVRPGQGPPGGSASPPTTSTTTTTTTTTSPAPDGIAESRVAPSWAVRPPAPASAVEAGPTGSDAPPAEVPARRNPTDGETADGHETETDDGSARRTRSPAGTPERKDAPPADSARPDPTADDGA